MKKLFTLSIAFLITTICFAQVPNFINYQAVARNASGAALINQNITVKLTINQGTTLLYTETRSVTTNALGLFNVKMGSSGASNTVGDLLTIDWLNTDPAITLKVELDVNNSGIFTDMGSQQLVTVPYAFAAQNAINSSQIAGRNVIATNPAVGQTLTWNGSAWAATTPVSPTYIGFRADVSTNQTISTLGDTLMFGYEQHDSGNVYNASTSTFTAPQAGMYMLYTTVTVYGPTNPGVGEVATLSFYSNLQGILQYGAGSTNAAQRILQNHNSISIMTVQHLSAGETVKIIITRVNPTANWIIPYGSSFGAYKIK